ncbi:MAG: flippase [Candidatus Lokiarchaeota archaeon]|nr:flippase [Candidatus Lokiarchaeota archaeon]
MKKFFKIPGSYKTLLQNFFSLSALQFFNYLFPLITLPYVVRVLGPEKFGLVNFAAAFVGYFVTISDYGFNLSATRQISVNRDDKNEVNKIFISVIFSKILLGIISFAILIIAILSFEIFRNEYLLYLISFGLVISTILFPFWLLQGLEKMKYIPLIHLVPKIIGTILIFTIIKNTDDFLLYALILSGVQLSIGIIGLLFAIRMIKLKWISPSFTSIKTQLSDGLEIFKSTIAINLYTNSNTFILGLLTNNEVVGYFSAADKIRSIAQSFLSITAQTIYPYVNKLLSESFEKYITFMRKVFRVSLVINGFISLVLLLFSDYLVKIILGNDFNDSAVLLRILALLPIISCITEIIGTQTLVPLRREKEYFKVFTLAVFSNLFLLFTLIPFMDGIGASIAIVGAETIAASGMLYYVSKNKINYF